MHLVDIINELENWTKRSTNKNVSPFWNRMYNAILPNLPFRIKKTQDNYRTAANSSQARHSPRIAAARNSKLEEEMPLDTESYIPCSGCVLVQRVAFRWHAFRYFCSYNTSYWRSYEASAEEWTTSTFFSFPATSFVTQSYKDAIVLSNVRSCGLLRTSELMTIRNR